MLNNGKIFVQIASYRDPELLPTLKDCLINAENPDNLVFSIAWQHSEDDEWDNLDEFKNDPRFKIIDINYKRSKGVCWARNLLQQQYNNEEYTLQLDSHHRFTKNWDTELILELKKLQEKGYKKPMLTGYIPHYEPGSELSNRESTPWRMNFDRFSPDGNVHFLPSSIDDYKERTEPVGARFYSAHFCFTLGQHAIEVPHDPEYYFHGEEISVAVRSFTWGYDLFHLHRTLIWHYYTRRGAIKQWDDDKKWPQRNDYCYYKNRKLFGMEQDNNNINWGDYGFGPHRTLEDYEKYAGISFKKRGVQQYTLEEKYPPNPVIENQEEYENSFSIRFKHCIDIGYHDVPYNDYTFWAVAFEDENGDEIFRQDADPNEIKNMKNDKDGYCKLWRSFETTKRVSKWIVWPHSAEHGWCDRLEGKI
jgi:hypothetical protein